MVEPRPPRLSHLLEVSLYVENLDRSEAFYGRLLGTERLLRDGRMAAIAAGGASVLLLFRRGSSAEASGTPGGTIPAHDGHGVQHVCFAVHAGELGGWERHLEALGVALESRVTWPRGGTSLYVRDPDGHSVELATPGLWANW